MDFPATPVTAVEAPEALVEALETLKAKPLGVKPLQDYT